MQHIRLKLSIILFFLLCLMAVKAQTVYVKELNGTQTNESLNSIQKMSFSSGNITINKTDGSSDTYSFANLRYLNFENLTTNSLTLERKKDVLLIYPNPVSDQLNVQLMSPGKEKLTVEIFTEQGRLIYIKTINELQSVYRLSVSSLQQGLYLCRITNGRNTETVKFLKH